MSSKDKPVFNIMSLTNFLLFIFIFVSFYYLATGKVDGNNRIILLVVLFCVIFYMFYYSKLFDTSTELVTGITDADVHTVINSDDLSTYQNNYSITGWFYIDDWNYKYGEAKVFLQRPDQEDGENSFNPMIFFNNTENNVTIAVDCYSSQSDYEAERFFCTINNINLQKWVHLGVVINNRTLDVYINGKLTKTCMLPGVPKVNNDSNIDVTPGNNIDNLNDNPGFKGYTSNILFFPKDLTPQQVYDEYRKGFGGNLFGSYDLKLVFYKDGQNTNTISLF
tara:strand:- start:1675 stop:2511 length:837 start_codon:yes stop_codon:yes gene_type:complete